MSTSNAPKLRYALTLACTGLCFAAGLPASAAPQTAIRAWPLVYHHQDPEAGTEELEIAWPLVDVRRTTEKDRWRLLHLLSRYEHAVSGETRNSALFNLAGTVTGKEGHWRFWVSPLLWFGASPQASHQVVFPIYCSMKSEQTTTHAVFPLYFGKTGAKQHTQGFLFLVWRGWRKWKHSYEEEERESRHLEVFPFYWGREEYRGDTKVKDLSALFPLYLDRWQDDCRPGRTWKSATRSGLFLVWSSSRVDSNEQRGTSGEDASFRVWPLFSKRHSLRRDHRKDETTTTDTVSLSPVFKRRLRTICRGRQGTTEEKLTGRMLPIVFWGHHRGRKGPDRKYGLVLPVLWHVAEGDTDIRALVPIGALIRDDDYSAVNLLGPLFTRVEHEKKRYVRYDALFPLLKWQKGETVSAVRALPLAGVHHEDGTRRTVNVAWPFYRRSEKAEGKSDPWWAFLLDEYAITSPGAKAATTRPELRTRLFPVFFAHRKPNSRATHLFPVFNASDRRFQNGCDTRSRGYGPLSLFYHHTHRQTPLSEERHVLGGILTHVSGETTEALSLFPIAGTHTRNSYNATQRADVEHRSRWFLWPLIRSSRQTETPVADGQGKTKHEQRVPILLKHQATLWHGSGESARELGVLNLPLCDYSLVSAERKRDGSSTWSLLDPLYSHTRSAQGETLGKSTGGWLSLSEKDICGFRSRTLLYRVFRQSANSRGSRWELMPFAYGERNIRGESAFGLLGGLVSFRRSADRTKLSFCFLPVFSRKRPEERLDADDARARAEKHLAYGLRYLEGQHPERALVELALAEPFFGQDAALFEKLGDAYRSAHEARPRQDIVEKVVGEIETFSSSYPVKHHVKPDGHFDWRQLFVTKAMEAYQQAETAGGGSALLRRKKLHLLAATPPHPRPARGQTPHRQAVRAKYERAMAEFADDFSLNLDYAMWLSGDRSTAKEAREHLDQMLRRWPSSALLRFRLASPAPGQRHGHAMGKQNGIKLAVEGARLTQDEPPYVPLKTQQAAPKNYRLECRRLALRQLQNATTTFVANKRYADALEHVDLLLELGLEHLQHAAAGDHGCGWVHLAPWAVRQLTTIMRNLDRLDELLPYLRKQTPRIRIPQEKRLWERSFSHLERDGSYLRAWSAYGPLPSHAWRSPTPLAQPAWSDLRNPLFTPYLNLQRKWDGADARACVCATRIECPEETDAHLLLGFDERAQLWLNGEPVFGPERRTIACLDELSVPVRLKKGENVLILRLENRRLGWGFTARLAAEDGTPLKSMGATPVHALPPDMKEQGP